MWLHVRMLRLSHFKRDWNRLKGKLNDFMYYIGYKYVLYTSLERYFFIFVSLKSLKK